MPLAADESVRALADSLARRCTIDLERASPLLARLYAVMTDADWLERVSPRQEVARAGDAASVFRAFQSLPAEPGYSTHISAVSRALTAGFAADHTHDEAMCGRVESAAGSLYLYGLFRATNVAALAGEGWPAGQLTLTLPINGLCAAAAVAELLLQGRMRWSRDEHGRVAPRDYIDLSGLPVVPGKDHLVAQMAEVRHRVFKAADGEDPHWPVVHDDQVQALRQRLRREHEVRDRQWRIAFKKGEGGPLEDPEQANRLACQLATPVLSYGTDDNELMRQVLQVDVATFDDQLAQFHKEVERALYPEQVKQRDLDVLTRRLAALQARIAHIQDSELKERLERALQAVSAGSSHRLEKSWLLRLQEGLKTVGEAAGGVKSYQEVVGLAGELGRTIADLLN